VTALLEARRLKKIFPTAHGEIVVLDSCDVALAAGETVAVVGPSGAGKSTLLNLLSGLDRPTDGRILYAGEPIQDLSGDRLAAWRRDTLGFVFQFHFLLPDFSALENLLVPVRLHGKVPAAAWDRARDLLGRMGLADRLDHLPGELSGGEQQRVALARAFMNGPRIVMADEPFGNLDREKGRDLADLLLSLQRERECALVIVTHDRGLAARADRVLEIRDGAVRPLAPGEVNP